MHALETIDKLNATAVAKNPGTYRVIEKTGLNIKEVHSFTEAADAQACFAQLTAAQVDRPGDSAQLIYPTISV
jgi:hypothetical protein